MTVTDLISDTTQRLINPIVSAAAPLLDIAVEPGTIKSAKGTEKYRQFFITRIRDFEAQLKESAYRESTILTARHLVCAFIDEMLLTQPWARTYAWQDKSLSWHFAHKKLANDDFFMLLKDALKSSTSNLDILELGYVCLSLGFQGKYRYSQDEKKELTAFANKIYNAIRKQRQEHSRQLFVPMPALQKKRWTIKLPSRRTMLVGGIILLLGIMSAYYYRLSPLNRSIKQSISILRFDIGTVE